MSSPITFPRFKAFVQGTNAPLAGGKVYFYAAGTSTAQDTYTDAGLGTVNANPVILDANGEASIWPGTSAYKVIIKDSLDVTQSTTDNYIPIASLPTSIGGHNQLTDGGFEMWQEATSYTGSATLKMLSSWSLKIPTGTASNFTISRQAPSRAGSRYCMRIARNAAATDAGDVSLSQDLETLNSFQFQGQLCTLSFYVRCGATFSGSIGGGYILAGAGTDEAWRTSAAYTSQAGVASLIYVPTTSWQRVTIAASAVAPTTLTQIGVVPIGVMTFSGTAGATDYIEIDDVQLELGGVATNFEQESIDALLRKDQRRYFKTFPYATVPAQNAGTTGAHTIPQTVAASTATSSFLPIPAWMRDVAGTITTYNPSATNAHPRNTTVGADCSATSATSDAGPAALVSFTAAGGSAAGNVQRLHYVVDRRI